MTAKIRIEKLAAAAERLDASNPAGWLSGPVHNAVLSLDPLDRVRFHRACAKYMTLDPTNTVTTVYLLALAETARAPKPTAPATKPFHERLITK